MSKFGKSGGEQYNPADTGSTGGSPEGASPTDRLTEGLRSIADAADSGTYSPDSPLAADSYRSYIGDEPIGEDVSYGDDFSQDSNRGGEKTTITIGEVADHGWATASDAAAPAAYEGHGHIDDERTHQTDQPASQAEGTAGEAGDHIDAQPSVYPDDARAFDLAEQAYLAAAADEQFADAAAEDVAGRLMAEQALIDELFNTSTPDDRDPLEAAAPTDDERAMAATVDPATQPIEGEVVDPDLDYILPPDDAVAIQPGADGSYRLGEEVTPVSHDTSADDADVNPQANAEVAIVDPANNSNTPHAQAREGLNRPLTPAEIAAYSRMLDDLSPSSSTAPDELISRLATGPEPSKGDSPAEARTVHVETLYELPDYDGAEVREEAPSSTVYEAPRRPDEATDSQPGDTPPWKTAFDGTPPWEAAFRDGRDDPDAPAQAKPAAATAGRKPTAERKSAAERKPAGRGREVVSALGAMAAGVFVAPASAVFQGHENVRASERKTSKVAGFAMEKIFNMKPFLVNFDGGHVNVWAKSAAEAQQKVAMPVTLKKPSTWKNIPGRLAPKNLGPRIRAGWNRN